MFDEKTERAIVQEPLMGQSASLRAGISREQAQRFFDRRNAVLAAQRATYKGTKHSMYNVIMGYLEEGFTEVEKLPAGRLRLKKGNTAVVLNRKVETNLVRVQLDIEPLARNY